MAILPIKGLKNYPLAILRREAGIIRDIYAGSKALARCYDIGAKLASCLKLPAADKSSGLPSYQMIGDQLYEEINRRGIILEAATLRGSEAEILEAIRRSLPAPIASRFPVTAEMLAAAGIIQGRKGTLLGALSDLYRSTSPLKRLIAVSQKMGVREAQITSGENQAQKIRSLESTVADLKKERSQDSLAQEAVGRIIDTLETSNPKKTLIENITDMLNVIAAEAWQVIGRSGKSEAAVWLAINPDGSIGIPYRYVIYDKENSLESAEVYHLDRSGSGDRLVLAGGKETLEVKGQSGQYLCIKPWEDFEVSERYMVKLTRDGRRELYERHFLSGPELIQSAVKRKAGRSTAAAARVAATLVGKVKNLKTASVELRPVVYEKAHLEPGQVIPFTTEGSFIRLCSAGSADPEIRDKKIAKGRAAENFLKIGIIEQTPGQPGNVAASMFKPLGYMIYDVNNFPKRRQNDMLISIVDVGSYFIISLVGFDKHGHAILYGCIEVTNPEVVPAELNTDDHRRLIDQFEMGKTFAGLAGKGIRNKIQQEESAKSHYLNMGGKLWELYQSGDRERLKGEEIHNASTMFLDIAGFTALSDKTSPKNVFKLLNNIWGEFAPIVERNGGWIDKYIGDAMMVVWGAPDREEGDVEKSVLTAIELQRHLQNFNSTQSMRDFYAENKISPVGITIGINSGDTIGGIIGHSESRASYSVTGDTVNVASRIQGAIKRGQILIGANTFKLLSPAFKKKLIEEFNAYNRDIKALKQHIISIHRKAGIAFSEKELDVKLSAYLRSYVDAEAKDIFVPNIFQAKNKEDLIESYFVRWDRQAYRKKFLLDAKITLPEAEGHLYSTPDTKEILAALSKIADPQKKKQMLQAYRRLLASFSAKKK